MWKKKRHEMSDSSVCERHPRWSENGDQIIIIIYYKMNPHFILFVSFISFPPSFLKVFNSDFNLFHIGCRVKSKGEKNDIKAMGESVKRTTYPLDTWETMTLNICKYEVVFLNKETIVLS